MKRTLLAVGVAVLASLLLVPQYTGSRPNRQGIISFGGPWEYEHQIWRQPFFCLNHGWEIQWDLFALQTVFAAVAAAVIVNLIPHRPWDT
jgi:hypothetical protein